MSESLLARLESAMTDARKSRDRLRTSLLSMTLSEIRNRRIELGREPLDEEVMEVLTRARKRRQEAAEQMRNGGRPELAEKEEEESRILAEYLPKPLSEAEVRGLVRELMEKGSREPGPLMGQLMPRLRNRFDGKEANRIVREELARA